MSRSTVRIALTFTLLLAAALSATGSAQPVHAAATIVVSVCGDEELRSAVAQANTDPGATITFDCDGTIELSEPIHIRASMTLDATGRTVTLSGAGLENVIVVGSEFLFGPTFWNVTVKGLTITSGGAGIHNYLSDVSLIDSILKDNTSSGIKNFGGAVTITNSTLSGNSGENGGAIHNGAAIHNDIFGTVTVTNSTIMGNNATYGGGIYNTYGTVTILNSALSDNHSLPTFTPAFIAGSGGGIYNASGDVTIIDSSLTGNSAYGIYSTQGGGVFNTDGGSLTVIGSTLDGNQANSGGAISNNIDSTATITDSTLTTNTGHNGGGVSNWGNLSLVRSTLSNNIADGASGAGVYTANGTLTVVDSTLSQNLADSAGGGIYVGDVGTATVSNSTISENSTTSAFGGGLVLNGSGTLSVTNSTISSNSSPWGGGIFGAATLTNTILADSTGGNCAFAVVDGGGNLADDATCGGVTQVSTASLNLGPLADNGGPTQTVALLPGSSAVNAGVASVCTADPVNSLDQRGFPRGTTNCDSGAYDTMSPPAPSDATAPIITYTLTPDAPSGSNGWYTGDVSIVWSVIDAESTATIDGGCLDQTVSSDTAPTGLILSCSASSDGGTASESVTLFRDATLPVVAVTGVSDAATYLLGSVPAVGCDTTDSTSGVEIEATLSISGGSVGTMTASCAGAVDTAGNVGSATATYIVVYSWSGFVGPVDSAPTLNSARAGRAIPVSFSLDGYYGMAAVTSVTSVATSCDAAAPTSTVEATATAGNSGLQYDMTTDQYTYVWKTSKSWAGTCRQLVLTLDDGTTHKANFMFKK